MGFDKNFAQLAIIETETKETITLINWFLSYNQHVENVTFETSPTRNWSNSQVTSTNTKSTNEVNRAFTKRDNREQQAKIKGEKREALEIQHSKTQKIFSN